MKIVNSNLEIINYYVLNLTFNAVPFGEEEPDEIISEAFPVDVDFGLQESDEGISMLFMKAEANFGENLEIGYSYFIETATFFRIIDEEKLDPQLVANLRSNSIVGMAYSILRGILNDVSSNGPYGRYMLPSVDLIDLVRRKSESSITSKEN